MIPRTFPFFLAFLAPTPTDCYNWDQGFLRAFHGSLLLAFLLSLALFAWFVLRPPNWLLANPYSRVVVSSLPLLLPSVFAGSSFALLRWPGFLDSALGIKEEYLQCGPDPALPGFLWGLLGGGVPAISQPFYMAAIGAALCALYIVVMVAITAAASKSGSPWRLKQFLSIERR